MRKDLGGSGGEEVLVCRLSQEGGRGVGVQLVGCAVVQRGGNMGAKAG